MASYEAVHALLNPKSIAIVGASPGGAGGWAGRIWSNLNKFGFAGPIYPVNPKYQELWGIKCYPTLEEIPGLVDHLVVLTSARTVSGIIQLAAACGTRSATVFSGGLGEGDDPAGRKLGQELKAILEQTGIAICGPNCLGNIIASSKTVTFTDQRMAGVAPGPVAVIGQSGGILGAVNRTLGDRGIQAGYVISSGNELNVTTADYIRYVVRDPEIKVILAFLESVHDRDNFLAACAEAKEAHKPIIALKIGVSEQSRAAAVSHTGSLAGSIEAFDAVARKYGILRVNNLDEMVECAQLIIHLGQWPMQEGLGIITFSGGLKELYYDVASRQNVKIPKLDILTEKFLQEILPVGTSLGNPLDTGVAGVSDDSFYFRCIDQMLDDPNVGMVLLQDELPRKDPGTKKMQRFEKLNERAKEGKKPLAIVTALSQGVTEYGLEVQERFSCLPFLQEVEKGLTAASLVQSYCMNRGNYQAGAALTPSLSGRGDRVKQLLGQRTGGALKPLNEVDSKSLLREYGISVLEEIVAHNLNEAVLAANSMAYPVVLKGISQTITHKSDAGIVKTNIQNEAGLRAAHDEIFAILCRDAAEDFEGILVAPYISGGIEVVLGLHHDPEMGHIVMFGSGGIWLELYKDVCFGKPPLTRTEAVEMVNSTKIARILTGYRGGCRHDLEAVVTSILNLSNMALELGNALASVDINPYTVLREGAGGFALDGLVVLRNHN